MIVCKNIFLSFISGVIGAVSVLWIYLAYCSPTIGTVNITGLVDSFVHEEAKKNISAAQLKNHIRSFSQHLESTLDTISKREHMVLVPREAVLAGSKDYTFLVEKRLNNILTSEDKQ